MRHFIAFAKAYPRRRSSSRGGDQLPERLVGGDSDCGGQIQAAAVGKHGNGQQLSRPRFQNGGGQTPSLRTEHKMAPYAKAGVVKRALRPRAEEKPRRFRVAGEVLGVAGIAAEEHLVPVVQAGAFEFPVLGGKSKRFNQNELAAG